MRRDFYLKNCKCINILYYTLPSCIYTYILPFFSFIRWIFNEKNVDLRSLFTNKTRGKFHPSLNSGTLFKILGAWKNDDIAALSMYFYMKFHIVISYKVVIVQLCWTLYVETQGKISTPPRQVNTPSRQTPLAYSAQALSIYWGH